MKKTRLSVLCGMCLALGLSSGAAEKPHIRASLYEWPAGAGPYSRLIVASNASRLPQKGLALPAGVSPAATLRELWNDWPVEASKIGDVEILAGRFVLIGI